VRQADSIFVPRPLKLIETDAAISPILRVREENGKCTLTLKRDATDQLDSIEYETEIGDRREVAGILDELGYHEVVKVVKVRRKGVLDTFRICVDEVEQLGIFIELEARLGDDADVNRVRSDCWTILSRCGFVEGDRVTTGYDRLVESES